MLDLKPTVCWRETILTDVSGPHSFIMLHFHTPPQVILNLAIHQAHLLNEPPTPLSSAINHHLATGQWAQSKGTLRSLTNSRWETVRARKEERSRRWKKGQYIENREERVRNRV